MALKDVSSRKPATTVKHGEKLEAIRSKDMDIGATFKGYVVKIQEFEGKYGPKLSIVFQNEDGSRVRIYCHGKLNYKIKDGLIKEGVYTEITRLADVKIGPNMGPDFKVAQDDERTLDDAALDSFSEPVKQDSRLLNTKGPSDAKSTRAAILAKAKRLDSGDDTAKN